MKYDPAEYEFTIGYPEPDTDIDQLWDEQIISDAESSTFRCRECAQIFDMADCAGCNCLVCYDCAMRYVEADNAPQNPFDGEW